MARCGFAKFVGSDCGKSSFQKNEECVSLDSCGKDITYHLRSINVFDPSLDTEIKLIFARAGKLR